MPSLNLLRIIHFLCVITFLVSTSHAQTATTTTLAVTSDGSAVTTVTSGTVVTLTATVKAGATPLTVGQVKFCDATAAHCEDTHLLATAQLTKAGTATYKFRPSIGSHSYKAAFQHTPHGASDYNGSTSSTTALTVTGGALTTTTIAQNGSVGNYTLVATVLGNGDVPPTGTASFLDVSNGNAALGSATLGTGTTARTLLVDLINNVDPSAIAVGDFNGDGIPDMAFASDTVTIWLGNGDGTFKPPETSMAISGVNIAVGDFNGDGILDLAVGGNPGTILLGNGDGTFTPKAGTPISGGPIEVGDFNRDGILDLVVADTVLLGNGDGTFKPIANSPAIIGGPIAVGDFNRDGIPDLAVVYGNVVSIFLGNGDGTFSPMAISSTLDVGCNIANDCEYYAIVVGDFTGNGVPDLAVASQGDDGSGCDCTESAVTILLGNGDGTFTSSSIELYDAEVRFTNNSGFAVGDFTGSGILDLATTLPEWSGVVFLMGNGEGAFTPSSDTILEMTPYPNAFAVGDFTGDGVSDLVVANFPYTGDGRVTVLRTENQFAKATVNGITMPIATGTHHVVASYLGDSNYQTSTSGGTLLTAAQGTPVVNLMASPNSLPYGAPVLLTATVTGSGLTPTGTVTFKSGGNAIGSTILNTGGIATLAINSLLLGNNSVTASYQGDSNYYAATSAAVVVTVNIAAQTITFAQPTSPVNYGVTPITLSATATSGLPVTFTVTGPGTLKGATLTITGVGTIVIDANQAGNANYFAAAQVQRSIVVNKAAQTISFAQPTSPVKYGVSPLNLSAIATSGLPVTFTVTGPAKLSGTALTINGAGTVVVTAHQAGNSDYATAPEVTKEIVVDKVDLTVTAVSTSVAYNQPIPALTYYTLAGFVNGDSTSVVSGLPVETTTAKKGSVPGQYPIDITIGTLKATNYGFVMVDGTLTINKSAQTITFTPPTSPVRYGVTPIILSATSTSGLPVTFTVTGPATLKSSTLTITGAGTVVVTAHQAGNSNYVAAASVSHVVVVDKANLTVTATSTSVAFNKPIPTLTYTVTGFKNGDTASVLTGAPVETTTAKQGSAAGKYPITITTGNLSAANYGGFVMVNGTLTITQ